MWDGALKTHSPHQVLATAARPFVAAVVFAPLNYFAVFGELEHAADFDRQLPHVAAVPLPLVHALGDDFVFAAKAVDGGCLLIELGAAPPLLVLLQHLHTAFGVDCRAVQVKLNYPPTAYAARYAHYRKRPIRVDAGRSALVFPKGWRDLRNPEHREST